MKKSTLIISSAMLLIFISVFSMGCKNGTGATGTAVITDTTGLSEFQAWKAGQQQIETAAAYSKTAASKNQVVKMTSSSTNEAKVEKKKGWSKAAKYTVIGAAGGGVMGAIINKKDPVKGAVIGAVILGGGGYIFGRSKDKKEGRY